MPSSRRSSQPRDQTLISHVSCLGRSHLGSQSGLKSQDAWSPSWRDEVKSKSLSCVQLFATLWTVQSMEFSRPEYWSGYLFPSPGDLPYPGIEPRSPALQADSLPAKLQGKPKNTVGSLSLLQQIFLTQEFNWGLLHIR